MIFKNYLPELCHYSLTIVPPFLSIILPEVLLEVETQILSANWSFRLPARRVPQIKGTCLLLAVWWWGVTRPVCKTSRGASFRGWNRHPNRRSRVAVVSRKRGTECADQLWFLWEPVLAANRARGTELANQWRRPKIIRSLLGF